MKNRICKIYGCDLGDTVEYHDAIVMTCCDCSKRYILNVREGSYDKEKYGYLNRRSAIQPSNMKAFMEVYGRTKYGRMLAGEEVSSELTEEEERVYEQDRLENDKLVAEIEGIEHDIISDLDTRIVGA